MLKGGSSSASQAQVAAGRKYSDGAGETAAQRRPSAGAEVSHGGLGETAPRRRPSASPEANRGRTPPPASGRRTSEELKVPRRDSLPSEGNIRRIWQRLDRGNSGAIQVRDIVANATFIQQECPLLLEEHGRLARGGVVKYQDVRRLLLGLMDRPVEQKSTDAPRMCEEQLRTFFDKLKDADGVITVAALVEHKDLVGKTYPALVPDFEKIDLDRDSKITWEELKVFNGGTAEWLDHQLDGVVGLAELKEQVRSFYRSMVLDRNRRQLGHDVQGLTKAPHMIFQGNPGTGKTTLGRIMAKLLHRIGVIAASELKEVQRPDLVAEHVGQTGPKTQAVIDSAKTGVLFIDEAYRLTGVSSKNDFGREALETLMASMNEPPGKTPVMIFAGYNQDMANFMRANDGLYRRISYTFDFTDYCPGDLAQILELCTSQQGFKVDAYLLKNNRQLLADLIEHNTLPRSRALMNGGICERIFDAAKQSLDARDDPDNPSVVLSEEDIRSACCAIPAPPEPLEQPRAVSTEAVPHPTMAPPSAPPPSACLAPLQQLMQSSPSETHQRNVWFHIGAGRSLRSIGACSPSNGFLVSVRFDRREAHRTVSRYAANRCPVFRETRIVHYSGESLLEFAVVERLRWGGTAFVGSATLALQGLDVFDEALELRAMDAPAGQLQVKVGWQILAGVTGGDLLQECHAVQP